MYLQIVEQVRHGIVAGVWQADEELPSVRAMASQHLINPNTVARAYLELEREGLVSKKRGTGTYISHLAAGWRPKHGSRIVEGLLDNALAKAMEFGIPANQVRALFEERLKHARKER
jgi:GntR family transcriptional regulator